jgi:hypothetical protein
VFELCCGDGSPKQANAHRSSVLGVKGEFVMESLREQAIEFINTIPDDKIVFVLDFFKGLEGFIDTNESMQTKAAFNSQSVKSAMGICKEYANPNLVHLEKEAWGMAMGEKHGLD